jgi:putative intracellular protease/amidase
MRIFGEESNTLDIEICFVATSLEPVKSSQQVTITPKYLVSDTTQKYDLFFIPGGSGTRTYVNSEDLMEYVKTHVEQSTWTMTVCTGAGILAKTGLVDGYNMT